MEGLERWQNNQMKKMGIGRLGLIFFMIGGMLFVVLGIPLLSAQNIPYILLSVFGVMLETIVFMVIYSLFIEKKYKKQ